MTKVGPTQTETTAEQQAANEGVMDKVKSALAPTDKKEKKKKKKATGASDAIKNEVGDTDNTMAASGYSNVDNPPDTQSNVIQDSSLIREPSAEADAGSSSGANAAAIGTAAGVGAAGAGAGVASTGRSTPAPINTADAQSRRHDVESPMNTAGTAVDASSPIDKSDLKNDIKHHKSYQRFLETEAKADSERIKQATQSADAANKFKNKYTNSPAKCQRRVEKARAREYKAEQYLSDAQAKYDKAVLDRQTAEHDFQAMVKHLEDLQLEAENKRKYLEDLRNKKSDADSMRQQKRESSAAQLGRAQTTLKSRSRFSFSK